MRNDILIAILQILKDHPDFRSEVIKFLLEPRRSDYNLDVFNYRIGDIVKHDTFGIGHIVGLDMNAKREVVFEIQWADDEFGVCHLHPSNISRG